MYIQQPLGFEVLWVHFYALIKHLNLAFLNNNFVQICYFN